MTIDPHGSVGASSTKGPKTADAYGKGNHPIAGSPQSRLVLERLEPYDGKLSSTVPRGAWAGDRPGATRWLTLTPSTAEYPRHRRRVSRCFPENCGFTQRMPW
jgi:hypothetical protein